MWRNGECKERGGQCREKGKCDEKGEQKPYIQLLCTAHLYSDEQTVVVILLIKFRNGSNTSLSFLRRFKYGKS